MNDRSSRRRRISPFARAAGLLGWIAGAAAIVAIVLIATGRSASSSIGLAAACGAVAALIVIVVEVTGVVRPASAQPDADPDPPVGSPHE